MKYQEYQNTFKYILIGVILLLNSASASTGITSNWQLLCFISLAIAVALIGIGYVIAYIANLELIKRSLKQEAVQLIFTIIAMAFFTVFMFILVNQIMPAINSEIGTTGNLMESALKTTEINLAKLDKYSGLLVQELERVGEEGSKTASCSFYGVGFSISTCSSFSVVQSPLTQALSIVYLGMADLSAQLFLLEFSKVFMLGAVLPLGLIFRSFQFTRKAGGILIAFALGFGIIFPAGVLMNQYLVYNLDTPSNPVIIRVDTDYTSDTCDEFDPGGTYNKAIKPGLDSIFDERFYGRLIENILFRSLFFTIINFLITLTFISWTAKAFGANIDLSVLTRMA